MSYNVSQELMVRKETVAELDTSREQKLLTAEEPASAISSVQIRSLQNRMEGLEQQIKKAMQTLTQRENYVNALAVDLEHMILQLINKLNKDIPNQTLIS